MPEADAAGARRLSSFARRAVAWPLFPVFLSVAWVLDRWVEGPAPASALWRPILVAVVLSIAIVVVLVLLVRDRLAAGLLAAAAVFAITFQWELATAAAVLGIVALAVARWRPGSVRDRLAALRPEVGGFLNLVGVGTVVLNAWPVPAIVTPPPMQLPAYAFQLTEGRPDVHVVLLDGYPRDDTLSDELGVSNEPFLAALAERGFSVSNDARSNYPKTWQTLASLFNGAYLGDLGLQAIGYPQDVRALTQVLNRGAMLEAFRDDGYRIVTSVSAFQDLALASADEVLDRGEPSHWEQLILQKTAIGSLITWVDRATWIDFQRDRIASNFAALDALATTEEGPILSFTHVMSPHPPFVFDADGSQPPAPECFPETCQLWEPRAEHLGMSRDEYAEALGEQVDYLNSRLLAAVDEITRADPTAVIILMSDHGARYDEDNEAEYFRAFFAARTPGHAGLFPDDVAPVNVFRRLVTAYGDADLPDLPYRAWLSDPVSILRLTPYTVEP